jgi:hypothetical protein
VPKAATPSISTHASKSKIQSQSDSPTSGFARFDSVACGGPDLNRLAGSTQAFVVVTDEAAGGRESHAVGGWQERGTNEDSAGRCL